MFYQVILLYLFLITNVLTHNGYENENIEEKKRAIVHKCCPKSKHTYYGRRPLYCCQDGLFSVEEDGYLLKECADLGIKSDLLVKTIRCAQKEMHGKNSVDICKVYCCKLFNDNKCSSLCFSNIRRANMSLDKLKFAMEICEENEQFGEFNNCINSKTISNKNDAELEEYCKKAINWFN